MRPKGRCSADPPSWTASPGTWRSTVAAFDDKAHAWEDYTRTPLGRLRQELTTRQLMQHVGSRPPGLRALDVGGGTGSYALPLAQLGHQVCLLDFSAQMLAIARHKVEEIDPSLLDRIDFCHASAQEIPGLFPADHFDLILCHTLLEYVSGPLEILQALVAVLRPGGVLSLLCANPYAEPLRWAIARGNLEKALSSLVEPGSAADLFGLARNALPGEDMREIVLQAGGAILAEYGVRTLADYLPVNRLADPTFFAQLLELEDAAGALLPYKLIARYNHLLIAKSGA
jgi:S-adenosylmethionine-dependent methyltransferase